MKHTRLSSSLMNDDKVGDVVGTTCTCEVGHVVSTAVDSVCVGEDEAQLLENKVLFQIVA